MLSFLDTHTRFFVWLLLLLVGGHVAAQERFTVSMEVRSEVTNRGFPNVMVSVFEAHPDGPDTVSKIVREYGKGVLYLFFDEKPKVGQYSVCISPLKSDSGEEDGNYERQYVDVAVPDEAVDCYEMAPVYVRRKRSKELKEVTATASRVMFYHKGDTLVYNASAFLLAEGSTLDALLDQMPGVKLDPSGEITCNGRHVEQLLINGRDLFNGNNVTMLENLAAYTIKDIAVYDKSGRVSEMMGRETGDSRYVMDVRLKREYAHGGTASVDGGYGTADRYLAKLFGMWYNEFVGVTAHGGANNLSYDKTPERKDDVWSASDMAEGVFSKVSGGLSYNASGADDRWEAKGLADVYGRRADNSSAAVMEYFPVGGTRSFEYSWSSMADNVLQVSTDHTFFAKLGGRGLLSVKPAFEFERADRSSLSLGATFDAAVDNCRQEDVAGIYGRNDTVMLSHMVNRIVDESLTRGDRFVASLRADADIKLKSTGQANMMSLKFDGYFNSDCGDKFERYVLNYGDDSTPAQLSHRHYGHRPNRELRATAEVKFLQFLDFMRMNLPFYYALRFKEIDETVSTYQLADLADYDPAWALDSILPDRCYAPIYDPGQSYGSFKREYVHHFSFAPTHRTPIFMRRAGMSATLRLLLDLDISDRFWAYSHRGERRTFRKVEALPRADVSLSMKRDGAGNKWQHHVDGSFRKYAYDMDAYIGLPTATPLLVYMGNDNLKNAWYWSGGYRAVCNGVGQRRHEVAGRAYGTVNQVSSIFYYDQVTGVRTYEPANGKFQLNVDARYNFFLPLDRLKRLTLQSNLLGRFRRSVDARDIYTSYTVTEKLKLSWNAGSRYRVSAFGDVKWMRYAYRGSGFVQSYVDTRYGLDALFVLPWNWSISTDYTFYTRRGYMVARMNRTDMVWNARVKKSILRGQLIFAVDAYDLLHQVTNVTMYTGQQMSSTHTSNCIPAYVLFHVQYRFNKQPK